ncbi:MAG: hypothetical protein GTO63_18310 [Anaerolineae bacterium]|nr:hypothetical protein [Anaerolineae bacterium]
MNGLFILMTVMFHYLPNNRQGAIKFLALFSLQFEKNLATYWEGWCLLLVSLLAFGRFLRSGNHATSERQAWMGLSVLAAGLSLDELGSIHERAQYLFSSWGLSGRLSALLPLAVPVLLVLSFTLWRMRQGSNHRPFWLALAGFALFGFVVLQEYHSNTR